MERLPLFAKLQASSLKLHHLTQRIFPLSQRQSRAMSRVGAASVIYTCEQSIVLVSRHHTKEPTICHEHPNKGSHLHCIHTFCQSSKLIMGNAGEKNDQERIKGGGIHLPRSTTSCDYGEEKRIAFSAPYIPNVSRGVNAQEPPRRIN